MRTALPLLAGTVLFLASGRLATLMASPAGDPISMKAPAETAKIFKHTRTEKLEMRYLLFLPAGYDPKGDKEWPMILFLHGAGERGSDIWKVATHGPPRLATNHMDLPFVIVSPQCPAGRIWSNDGLLALLDEIIQSHRIDTNRIYLTGLSMGGFGTWDLGLAHPERFAAIAPICGGGEILNALLASGEDATDLKALGIWAFHGAKDPVVPLSESERMVGAARRAGITDVKLTVYPEALHDAWTQTYSNPELYQWLLQHEKKTASKP